MPLIIISLVLSATLYGKWADEPVALIVFSIGAVLMALSVVNLALVVKNVRVKAYFYGNSAAQLILLGFLALIFVPAAVLFFLDIAVLATLGEKKTPEERALHPPVPITKVYRWAVILGAAVLLVSMLLPWAVIEEETISLFGFYVALVTHSHLPGFSITPVQVVFALLSFALPPVSLICSGLGLVRRRMSLVAGALALTAGLSGVAVFGAGSGIAAYGIVGSGVVTISAFAALRGTKGGPAAPPN